VTQETYADACSISIGSLDAMTVIEVTGEVDIATVSLLAKALAEAVKAGKSHVILDARRLAYVDSAGIQTLLSTRMKLATKGRKLIIVGCHGVFHRIMKISMLETQFLMYPSIDEAMECLSKNSE
jgi:anti-anti-sigma factor